ncbi:MAG: lysophospholipid acyltransferase family protein [Moraxellaceae bacterium]|nr:lysophospholipid acyltransferase family protein [Moraxellaceae bacterium]
MTGLVQRIANLVDRPWRILATGFCFTVFGLGGLLMLLIVLPVLALVRDPQQRNRWARSLIHHSFRLFTRLMEIVGVISVEWRDIERLRRGGQLLLATHPSLIDVVLLISVVPRPDCVVKAALWDNPCMMGPLKIAGFIRNDGGPQLVEDCIASLRAGNTLVIFPEGTRSKPGQPMQLQRGAANVAVRGERRLTPVLISSSEPMLTKGTPWWQVPQRRPHFVVEARAEMPIESLIPPEREAALEARALTTALRDYFTEELKLHASTC